jgi:PAS domain S-box-containing protein
MEMADLLRLGLAYQLITPPFGAPRRFTYVGGLCEEMTGLAPEEVMADPEQLYGQVLPPHRQALERAEAAAIATLSRFEVEVRMRRTDGEPRWRRITSTPLAQPDGSIVWNGLMIDVTDTRRAAEDLRDQRQRLEAAVEATGLGFWEWNVRTDRVVWSARNCEIFGLPARRTIMTIEEYGALVHEEDRNALGESYERARDGAGSDFLLEHRTAHQPGGLTRWVQARGRIVKEDGEPVLVVGTTLDISEQKAGEDRRALLMGELAHRAKNGIQVMMGIVVQTARGVDSVKGFEQVLLARLRALANSQDLVTASGGQPVLLRDVVTTTLSPFGEAKFQIEDLADVNVPAEVAVALGLLLHELSTNAVKYGALSSSAGCVRLARGEDAKGHSVLCWEERDGPRVTAPQRKGFGSRLLEVGLAAQGGKVEAEFAPGGFVAKIHFPIAAAPRA